MDIMGELLASQSKKLTNIFRGQQIEGEVIAITDQELIIDLGAKSEGVLSKRELSEPQKDIKIGDKIKAFVYMSENEHGQVVLSTSSKTKVSSKAYGSNWQKFAQAQNQKNKLQGTVIEVNKGGLIVEVDGVRGFLPNSQVGFELLSKSGQGMENLIGQDLSVIVIETDQANNKLIFSQRGQISQEVKNKLKSFKSGQKAMGKIVAILPFGLVVDISGVEGLVFISDVAWEKVEDLQSNFTAGSEIEVLVIGADEELGRLNLSIKKLIKDPFEKIAEDFPADEVIKAEVSQVTEAGVIFKLKNGVEGFLPASKMNPDVKFEAGKGVTLLIDSVDKARRRVNLAPFVTSTAGLIYK